jgi:hypothetical protein
MLLIKTDLYYHDADKNAAADRGLSRRSLCVEWELVTVVGSERGASECCRGGTMVDRLNVHLFACTRGTVLHFVEELLHGVRTAPLTRGELLEGLEKLPHDQLCGNERP